ncbi:hypothetical protein BDZ90DRAFT_280686 [Jaminaea rosea]|uniref:Uncharacterized protein n=1 Tax=Jaminaea rosea TaxID=1569628 RepID=A0A316ULL0_9BASI|nr:hypothetical protein BDZ90DRAFT_280686 [Jaminaea rosea]PWN26147.1 hypothetical protein BDZ90DRAFT_280686 [Jaminaea rosea]
MASFSSSSSFSSPSRRYQEGDKENTPSPSSSHSHSIAATPLPRRKALLSEVIAQSRTPSATPKPPKPLPPRTPASALKSILRQSETPSSSSMLGGGSSSSSSSGRGVEWGYRMTDEGDVSKISVTTAGSTAAPTSNHEEHCEEDEEQQASSSRLSLPSTNANTSTSTSRTSIRSTRPPTAPAALDASTSASTDLSLSSLSNTGGPLLSMGENASNSNLLRHLDDSMNSGSVLSVGRTPRAVSQTRNRPTSSPNPSITATPRPMRPRQAAAQPLLPPGKQSPSSSLHAHSSSPATEMPRPASTLPSQTQAHAHAHAHVPRERLSTGTTISTNSSSLSVADMSTLSSQSLNDSFFRREGEKLRVAFWGGQEQCGQEQAKEEVEDVQVAESSDVPAGEEMRGKGDAEVHESSVADVSQAGISAVHSSDGQGEEEKDEDEEQAEEKDEDEEQAEEQAEASLPAVVEPEVSMTSEAQSFETSSPRSMLDSPTVKIAARSPQPSPQHDANTSAVSASRQLEADSASPSSSSITASSASPSPKPAASPAPRRPESGYTASPSADKLRRLALGRASVERLRAGGDSAPRATKGRTSGGSATSAASSDFVSFATAGQSAEEDGELETEVETEEDAEAQQERSAQSPARVVASPKMKDKTMRKQMQSPHPAAAQTHGHFAEMATPSPTRRPASAISSPTQQQWPPTPATSLSLPPSGSPPSGDAQTRLLAVRHALDEYLFTHSSRLSTLSVRLTSTLSEASLLRDVLTSELESKSQLLRELAGVKWELEERMRDKEGVLEEWKREREEGERRDAELRRLVERMREQVGRRVGVAAANAASGVGSGDEEVIRLRDELTHERELREQQRRDYEVRLLAVRATSSSPSSQRSREASPQPSASTEEIARLARESVERDHEVRVYSLQRDHEEALESLEEQLIEAQRERDDALQRAEGMEEVERERDDARQERDDAREERDEACDAREALSEELAKAQRERDEAVAERDEAADGSKGRQASTHEVEELRAANEELSTRLEELIAEREERDQAHQAALAALERELKQNHDADVEHQRGEAAAKHDQLHAIALRMEQEREELLAAVADMERTVVTPQEARIAELEHQVAEQTKQLQSSSSSAEAAELQARCDKLAAQVGDRGLTITKLERQNEKLELEIQNHAMALVAKQEELALLKRKVRKAGLVTPGQTPASLDDGRYEAASSSWEHGAPEEILERGPVPAKARGRRTMDGAGAAAGGPLRSATVNQVVNEDQEDLAEEEATPKTRRVVHHPRHSTIAVRPSHSRSSSQASQSDQEQQTEERHRISLSSTGSSSSASLQKRTTRASSRDLTGTTFPDVPTHSIASEGTYGGLEEPMSLTNVSRSRQSLSLSRPSLPANAAGRRALVGRASTNSSRSSVSSASSNSSRMSLSGGASMSKMPGMESFLAKRRAAGEAVARMSAMSDATPRRSRGWAEQEQENLMPA